MGIILKALFGLATTEEAAAIFRRHTGRTTPPTGPAREIWVVAGRRGGKSLIATLIAVYVACFRRGHVPTDSSGWAVVVVLAADRDQARVVLRHVAGLIDGAPMLARMVHSRTAEALHLRNGVSIEVHTANLAPGAGPGQDPVALAAASGASARRATPAGGPALAYNLRAVRAYLLREEFQFFGGYQSAPWAGKFLDRWCTQTMRSRLAPMQKVARMLRRHRTLLLNWFRVKGTISSGAVIQFQRLAEREDVLGTVVPRERRADGLRRPRTAGIAELGQRLGRLDPGDDGPDDPHPGDAGDARSLRGGAARSSP